MASDQEYKEYKKKEAERVLSDLMQNNRFVPLFVECFATLASKGGDYTQGEHANDALAHFREAAKEVDITMEKVWMVFFRKHLAAIFRYCKQGQVESEPIESRIIDAINYLALFWLMTEENKNKEKSFASKFEAAKDYKLLAEKASRVGPVKGK